MYIEKIKAWKWLVTPSQRSQRRRRYTVVKRKDETFSCTCMSYRYNSEVCKHIQAVVTQEQSIEDAVQAAWENSTEYAQKVGAV